MFSSRTAIKRFGSVQLWNRERAVETIEYIGIGAEVVRTTQCWISSLNDAIDCPPAEEIAQAPPEVLITREPTPPPNWPCALVAPEYYDQCVQGPQPPPTEPPPPTLEDRFIDFLNYSEEASQAAQDDLEELLAGLPEDQRGTLLAGIPGLLLLFLLLLASPVGGAALLGSAGLLAALLAGWLYGSGHEAGFSNLAAALSGLFAWVLAVFGVDALGRLALSVRERRRAAHLAKLAPQEPPPEGDLWDELLWVVGGIALAEPSPFGELGWLGLVGFRALVLFAAGGLALSFSRPADYSSLTPGRHTAIEQQQEEQQFVSNNSLAAEVRAVRSQQALLTEGEGQLAEIERRLLAEIAGPSMTPPNPDDPNDPWGTEGEDPATGAARFLPADVAKEFYGEVEAIRGGGIVGRYWGNRSLQYSNWLTTRGTAMRIEAAGRQIARSVLKLSRGNSAQNLDCFSVPADVVMFVGRIRGGAPWATQVWIDDRSYQRLVPVPC